MKKIDDFERILERMNIRKKALDLTNIVIAEKTGLNANTVGRIMNGKPCNVYAFMMVVEALGLEILAF